jgi:hypothetical protein
MAGWAFNIPVRLPSCPPRPLYRGAVLATHQRLPAVVPRTAPQSNALWASLQVTVLNFTLVPPPFRVIVLDCAECIWSCVLSYTSHRSTTPGCRSCTPPPPRLFPRQCKGHQGLTVRDVYLDEKRR